MISCRYIHLCFFLLLCCALSWLLSHTRTTCRVSAGHEITIVFHQTTNHKDNDATSTAMPMPTPTPTPLELIWFRFETPRHWGNVCWKFSLKVRPEAFVVCEKWHVWKLSAFPCANWRSQGITFIHYANLEARQRKIARVFIHSN